MSPDKVLSGLFFYLRYMDNSGEQCSKIRVAIQGEQGCYHELAGVFQPIIVKKSIKGYEIIAVNRKN